MEPGVKTVALIIFLAFMIPVAWLSFKISNEHKADGVTPGSKEKIKKYFKMQGLLVAGLICAMGLFYLVLHLVNAQHK